MAVEFMKASLSAPGRGVSISSRGLLAPYIMTRHHQTCWDFKGHLISPRGGEQAFHKVYIETIDYNAKPDQSEKKRVSWIFPVDPVLSDSAS